MKTDTKQSSEEENGRGSLHRLVRHSGRAAYRIKRNPLEGRFADAWRSRQDSGLFEYLMGDGTHRGEITERDEMVAATIIQWLGSPVGQAFLEDVSSTPNAGSEPQREKGNYAN